MYHTALRPVALLIAAVAALPAAVVCHPTNPVTALTADDAKLIFLGSRTNWDHGAKIVVAVLEGQDDLVNQLSGKSPSQFATHWKRLVFTGKAGAPKTFNKPEELVAFVTANEGAVGFVPDGANGAAKIVPVQ